MGYRLGLKDNHGLSSVSEVGLNTGNEDIKKSFTARSGIRFNPQTSLSISFNESISSNINGYSIDIRSISRDYISFGNNLSKGFPFLNWSFRIGGLEKIGFIKPYVSSVSLEHAFSGNRIYHGNLMKMELHQLIYLVYHLLKMILMTVFNYLE